MRRLGLPLWTAVVLLAFATPVSAEWFADAYLGPAVTQGSTLSLTLFNQEFKEDINGRSSPEFGLRLGRWLDDFELPWLGFAVDVSYFRPATDVQTVPISLLVMARASLLKDEEFPHGRLQPYAGIGGGLFISNASGGIGFHDVDDTSVDIGLDVRVGLAYQFLPNWAAFTEYRFTHVSPSWNVKVFGGETSADTTFNTHHVLLGISYRF